MPAFDSVELNRTVAEPLDGVRSRDMHAKRAPAEYNQAPQRNQGWMHPTKRPKGQCSKTVAAWEGLKGGKRQGSHAWRFSDVSSRKVRQRSVSGDRESETFCVSVAEVSVHRSMQEIHACTTCMCTQSSCCPARQHVTAARNC